MSRRRQLDEEVSLCPARVLGDDFSHRRVIPGRYVVVIQDAVRIAVERRRIQLHLRSIALRVEAVAGGLISGHLERDVHLAEGIPPDRITGIVVYLDADRECVG